jgi:hypothetical protein
MLTQSVFFDSAVTQELHPSPDFISTQVRGTTAVVLRQIPDRVDVLAFG